MPYRKTYRKRSSTKKAPAKKTMAKIAKAVVLRMTDRKHFDFATAFGLGSFGTTLTGISALDPTLIELNAPRVNQPDSDRHGSKIYITRISFGLQVTPGTAIPIAYARLILVRWPRNTTVAPVAGNILEFPTIAAGAIISPYTSDSPLQVVCDKFISYGVQADSRSGPKQAVQKFVCDFRKKPLMVQYADSLTGGAASDIESGVMRWFLVCTDSTGSAVLTQRVEYYEN